MTPPAKGEVKNEFLQPATKRDKDMVITTIQVKAIGLEPIARLKVTEKPGSTRTRTQSQPVTG